MKKLFIPFICFLLLAFVSSTGARMTLPICGGPSPTGAANCSTNQGWTDEEAESQAYTIIWKYDATCSGVPNELAAYTKYADDPANEIKYMVYADNGSGTDPTGTPVYTSAAIYGGSTTFTWNAEDTAITYNFQSGTTYWIGYCVESTTQIRAAVDSNGSGKVRYKDAASCFADPSSYTWPTASDTEDDSMDMSIRLEY